ncbi:MAG: DUF2231 domain-containing protein [Nitrosospira sp.]|nr:DUF2231 domain-containing protein [Nitrosospira sp.]
MKIPRITKRVPSTLSLRGHPIHPMLINFPIGFLFGAFASDLAYLWTADPFWARGSFWLIFAGLAGGAVAAMAGFIDFITVRAIREHVESWNHFISAIMGLSLAMANLVLRWQDMGAIMPWGLVLSGATVAMLSLAGWLGGHLVFRHLIGTGE